VTLFRRTHSDEIAVVPMTAEHLTEVMLIESSAFPTPWSKSLYRSELEIADTRIYLCVVERGRVIGYIGAMLVIDEVHITTIAVKESEQRRGIGKALLLHSLTIARSRGALAATLEVRVSSQGAHSLYHRFGFAPAGIRKNYYAEEHEDALIMWSHDLQGDEFNARLITIGSELKRQGLPLPTTSDSES
jgi:ribosomal-protein-alanine N-acetyltransferase